MADVTAEKLCAAEGCGRPRVARGWCHTHYARVRRTGEPGGPITGTGGRPRKPRAICSIDGCDRVHSAHGYCKQHGRRIETCGTTEKPPPRKKAKRYCSSDGCEARYYAKGLCRTHYHRNRWRTQQHQPQPQPTPESPRQLPPSRGRVQPVVRKRCNGAWQVITATGIHEFASWSEAATFGYRAGVRSQAMRKKVRITGPDVACKAPGCDGAVTAMGFCGRHYYRMKNTGSLELLARAAKGS